MNKKKKTSYFILITILIVLIGLYFLYREEINLLQLFADWAFPNDQNKNGKTTELLLKVLGGIAILIGLRFAMIRAKSSLKAVENQSVSINNQTRQIELTQQSQINETFKNAIEHLGSEKEPIILGGITELHFISKEYPEKYREVVLNIFCSKIRSEASVKKERDKISTTITQSIIDYIFRTDVYEDLPKNLEFCHLESINLDKTHIKDTNLKFSTLPFSLSNITFTNCDLTSCYRSVSTGYKKITFDNCNLFHAFFLGVKFEELKIISPDKTSLGFRFLDCEFKKTDLLTKISSGTFFSCEFTGTNFGGNISSCQFFGSSFKNINLNKISLSRCNFFACKFVKFSTNGWIMNSIFKGINDEYSSFFKLEEILEKSLNKGFNLSILNYDESLFLNNEIGEISEENISNIIADYNDLDKEYEKQFTPIQQNNQS